MTYKSCNCVNIDMDGKGLVRKLFDRSNDVNAVRFVNKSLGNVPCSPNRDISLKKIKIVMEIIIRTQSMLTTW